MLLITKILLTAKKHLIPKKIFVLLIKTYFRAKKILLATLKAMNVVSTWTFCAVNKVFLVVRTLFLMEKMIFLNALKLIMFTVSVMSYLAKLMLIVYNCVKCVAKSTYSTTKMSFKSVKSIMFNIFLKSKKLIVFAGRVMSYFAKLMLFIYNCTKCVAQTVYSIANMIFKSVKSIIFSIFLNSKKLIMFTVRIMSYFAKLMLFIYNCTKCVAETTYSITKMIFKSVKSIIFIMKMPLYAIQNISYLGKKIFIKPVAKKPFFGPKVFMVVKALFLIMKMPFHAIQIIFYKGKKSITKMPYFYGPKMLTFFATKIRSGYKGAKGVHILNIFMVMQCFFDVIILWKLLKR